MKKSNKGFTLVELLAAIVIMGILLIFAAPVIVEMVSNSRNKMYVADAKKLVAQAEYKIKSASSTIEKPSPDDAIVISLVYLNDDDFEVAPNRGEYVKDASFVVVKNNNGKLEYSVALVENLTPKKDRKKSSYKGIELIKSDALQGRDATKYVKGIKASDLMRVEASTNPVNTTYINDKIGAGYIRNVSRIYNRPDLSDAASKGGLDNPKILKTTIASTSGKKYNSLDATLSLTASDKDNDTEDLTVYTSTISYEDADREANKQPYGKDNMYTKEFNFAEKTYNNGQGFNYEYGGNVVLYVIVKDPDDNEAKATIPYEIHKNEPPVISLEDSGFTKLPEDKVNLSTALLRLVVEDDIDSNEDLQVCYTSNVAAQTCDNYKSYATEFSSGEKRYSFNSNKCALSGQTMRVKVFVKDKFGKETSEVLNDYQIHNNKPPEIKNVTVTSEEERFTKTGSLNVRIRVEGSDDLSYDENLKVKVASGSKTLGPVDYNPDGEIAFTLDGEYDGKPRNIIVTLIDECGVEASRTISNYQVYDNKPPEIKNVQLKTTDIACNNEKYCPIPEDENTNGNVKARVDFEVTDDIDYENTDDKVSICVSEDPNYCNIDNNYVKFSDFDGTYEFNKNKSENAKYDGTKKQLYIYAKDSKDKKVEKPATATYTLYKNKKPDFSSFLIDSKPEVFTTDGSLNTTIFLAEVEDDIDSINDLDYVISDGKATKTGSLADYNEEEGIDFTLSGKYDGKERTVTVSIKDKYSESASASTKYMVYKNEAPKIQDLEIIPIQETCKYPYLCPYYNQGKENEDGEIVSTSTGYNRVKVSFNVIDDIDFSVTEEDDADEEQIDDSDVKTDILVCISDDADYCKDKNNYIPHSEFYKNNEEYEFNKGKKNPFDGTTKTLYVYAVDSMDEESVETREYKLYKNEKPTIDFQEIKTSDERGINATTATYELNAKDDFELSSNLKVKICYKEEGSNTEKCPGGYQDYKDSYDIDFEVTKYNGQKFNIYSYVKDSFDEEIKSESLEYQLYADDNPKISSVAAIIEGGEEVEVPAEGDSEEENDRKCFYDDENGKYYDKNGEETDLETYESQCAPKFSCEEVDGIYYDKNNNEISQAEYNNICLPRITNTKEGITDDYLQVSVIVNDPFDTYTMCVSKDENSCTNYIGKPDGSRFDGNSLNSNMIYFVEPQGIKYTTGDNAQTQDSYYLFVKDSYGKVSEATMFGGTKYKECENVEENTDKVEYTLKNSSDTKISAERCGGRCYKATAEDVNEQREQAEANEEKLDPSEILEDTSGIFSRYKQTIYYRDRFNSSKSCPSTKTEADELSAEDIEAAETKYCDFKDCFYNTHKSSYETNTIGMTKLEEVEEETTVYNDLEDENVYEVNSYFKQYISSYDEKRDLLIFNPTNYKISTEAYNAANSQYKFNKDDTDYYVRAILKEVD